MTSILTTTDPNFIYSTSEELCQGNNAWAIFHRLAELERSPLSLETA